MMKNLKSFNDSQKRKTLKPNCHLISRQSGELYKNIGEQNSPDWSKNLDEILSSHRKEKMSTDEIKKNTNYYYRRSIFDKLHHRQSHLSLNLNLYI